MTPSELLDRIRKNQEIPFRLLLVGDDPYLTRELKMALRARRLEVSQAEFKKSGPERDQEDLSMGGSLFSSASLLWITKCSALSSWKAEAKNIWKKMAERADGQSFYIWVQVPVDKRSNWSGLEMLSECRLEVEESGKAQWLKRMNDERAAGLSADRLEFLLRSFDESLLNYDTWIELWALGGDGWAEVALGWVPLAGKRNSGHTSRLLAPNENAAFSWVNCVLSTSREHRARSYLLLDYLLEQGQEPLQLLGLIGKSLRILASLERGESPLGQPDFLVSKMRDVARNNAKTKRGLRLLKRCAEIDRLLKSTTNHPRALLGSLSLP